VHAREGRKFVSNKKIFTDDWTIEELQRVTERFNEVITLPVNVEIRNDRRVLNLDESANYLQESEKIVLMDCSCRVRWGKCDAPIHTCLRLNERAEEALALDELRKLNPEEVTVEQALEVLRESHEHGLVHMALAVDQTEINEICSCCLCCCAALSSSVRFGLASKLITSKMVSYSDEGKCNDCGVCLKRCPFNARIIVDGTYVTQPNNCMGCGLCVSTCNANALKLIEKNCVLRM
jgi:electron transport complex protein RnfB